MIKEQKRFPCIYYIKNVETNDLYIGSTFEYITRISAHLKRLFAGNHHSIHLQRAWNKYTYKNFVHGIYEHLPNITNDELRQAEQLYLDREKPAYNVSDSATRNIMSEEAALRASDRESKFYIVQDPSGKEHLIKNLAKFCRENEINESAFRTVLFGNSSNYHGWKIRRIDKDYKYVNRREKAYIITHPDGREEEITNLTKFCRSNNISQPSMSSVALGKRLNHKGWKCRYAKL